MNKQELDLQARTRIRHQTVWSPWEQYGPLSGLKPIEEELKRARAHTIEGYMASVDADMALKEIERDRGAELARAELEQEMKLALEKYETERRRLAIKMAADDYFLAAKRYEAHVRNIIMSAREYAAAMEREQAKLEKAKAELAVEKEHLRIKDLTAQVFIQAVEKAMVEADVAKMKLQAAKARVDIIEAEVAAKRAEVSMIEAEVKEAMAEAEKADIIADLASIFAQVVVKGLTSVKLDVETKEIEAGFRYVATKLSDMLRLWDIRTHIMELRHEAEQRLLEEILELGEAEKRALDLRLLALLYDRDALDYEIEKTNDAIEMERFLREKLDGVKLENMRYKHLAEIGLLNKNVWAERIIDRARVAASRNRRQITHSSTVSYEYHSK